MDSPHPNRILGSPYLSKQLSKCTLCDYCNKQLRRAIDLAKVACHFNLLIYFSLKLVYPIFGLECMAIALMWMKRDQEILLPGI